MHVHIDEPRILTHVMDALPGLTTVSGAVESAHFIRAPWVAERSHVNPIDIRRVNYHPPDRLSALKPLKLPC